MCAALTLLCPSQSSCCTFLSDFEVRPSRLISPLVRWLPKTGVYGELRRHKEPRKGACLNGAIPRTGSQSEKGACLDGAVLRAGS